MPQPTCLRAGAEVVLTGIQARADCNGRRGAARSFDPSKGRYAVDLGAGSGQPAETLSLKRANLVQCLQVQLRPPAGGALPEAAQGEERATLAG